MVNMMPTIEAHSAQTTQPNIRAFIEDKVRQLALKYYPSAEEVEEEIAKDIKGVQLYEISIEHLCGKQIQEK